MCDTHKLATCLNGRHIVGEAGMVSRVPLSCSTVRKALQWRTDPHRGKGANLGMALIKARMTCRNANRRFKFGAGVRANLVEG